MSPKAAVNLCETQPGHECSGVGEQRSRCPRGGQYHWVAAAPQVSHSQQTWSHSHSEYCTAVAPATKSYDLRQNPLFCARDTSVSVPRVVTCCTVSGAPIRQTRWPNGQPVWSAVLRGSVAPRLPCRNATCKGLRNTGFRAATSIFPSLVTLLVFTVEQRSLSWPPSYRARVVAPPPGDQPASR